VSRADERGAELAAADGAVPPPGVDVWAKLSLSLTGIHQEMAAAREQRSRAIRAIHPIKIQVPTLPGANGTLDFPDLLGPHGGYVWDIHRVVASGFTAGTVTMFSGGGGNQEFQFTAAGLLTYGKLQLTLFRGDRLTFVAAGITGSVILLVGGLQVEEALFADYAI
jgi:hypothetical protein